MSKSNKEKLKQILAGKLSAQDILDLPPEWDVWDQEPDGRFSQHVLRSQWEINEAKKSGTYLEPVYKSEEELDAHTRIRSRKNKNYCCVKIIREPYPPEIEARVKITEERMAELGITWGQLDFNITADDYLERFKTSKHYGAQ